MKPEITCGAIPALVGAFCLAACVAQFHNDAPFGASVMGGLAGANIQLAICSLIRYTKDYGARR